MRTNRMAWVLGAVALLLFPALFSARAEAQGSAQWGKKLTGNYDIRPNGGISYSDSLVYPARMTVNGEQYVLEASKDRDNILVKMLFTGTLYADSTSFNVDSTGVPTDVHQYRNLKLVFFIAPQDSAPAAAQRFYRIAYQSREYVNGIADSTGVAAEYGLPLSNYGILNGGTAAAIGSDSLQFGQVTPPTNFEAGSDEQILVVDAHRSMVTPVGQANFNLPRSGLAVPLQWVGCPHQFMNFGMRMRLLKVAGAQKRIKYTVWLLGWS